MPQEPKKRHSRARQGKRRASIHLRITDTSHRLHKFYEGLKNETPTVTKVEETASK